MGRGIEHGGWLVMEKVSIQIANVTNIRIVEHTTLEIKTQNCCKYSTVHQMYESL